MTIAPTSARATWDDVEVEIRRLAESRESFETALDLPTRITSYDPVRRVTVETRRGTSFVDLEDIKACWATFEKRGSIRRRDVLEPGRCSAFMMALFSRVRGVRSEDGDEPYLVLPK